jgi:hypothetical protein
MSGLLVACRRTWRQIHSTSLVVQIPGANKLVAYSELTASKPAGMDWNDSPTSPLSVMVGMMNLAPSAPADPVVGVDREAPFLCEAEYGGVEISYCTCGTNEALSF